MTDEVRPRGSGSRAAGRVAVALIVVGLLGAVVTVLMGRAASAPEAAGAGVPADPRPDVTPAAAPDEDCAARLRAIRSAAQSFDAAFEGAVDEYTDFEVVTWADQVVLLEGFADALRPPFARLSRLPTPTAGPARSVATDVRSGAFRAMGGFDAMIISSRLADVARFEAADGRTSDALDDFYAGLAVLLELETTAFADVCPRG